MMSTNLIDLFSNLFNQSLSDIKLTINQLSPNIPKKIINTSTIKSVNKIESPLYVKGINNLLQFTIKGTNRLITIIGETHEDKPKQLCNNGNISVMNYISKILNHDNFTKNNTKIFIEIPNTDIKLNKQNTLSFQLNEMFNNSGKYNLNRKHFFGFDCRSIILKEDNFPNLVYILYNTPQRLLKWKKESIQKLYLFPFYNDKIHDDFFPKKELYFDKKTNNWLIPSELYLFLSDTYKQELENIGYRLKHKIEKWNIYNNDEKMILIFEIQVYLSKFTDVCLLDNIFKESLKNNIVVLCGYKHCENILSLVENLDSIELLYYNANGECFDIKDSIYTLN